MARPWATSLIKKPANLYGDPRHAPSGTLQAGQRFDHLEPAVLEVGDDLQGPDDRGFNRPPCQQQHHPGTEFALT